MPKFKAGDEVILVRHESDSRENLELGAVGIVKRFDAEDEGVFVKWNKYSLSETWWVVNSCIELNTIEANE